jgi:PKD repeat protein
MIRTQGIDCQPGDPAGPDDSECPGGSTPHAGGYTYADFGRVSGGGPEVHADGEIWGETLWDIRRALGSQTAEQLITQGMELSPADPSFLDERNAILLADAIDGGAHQAALWQVFARRGMGYFATTRGADDTHPTADFRTPAGNEMPMSSFTATPAAPMSGQNVMFDGSASHAPDGSIVAASWSFGDGSAATGLGVHHRFGRPGRYTITLTVRDHAGLSSTSTAVVTVRDRPPSVRMTWHPKHVRALHSVRFVTTAHDSDGRVVSYRYVFGGGHVSRGRVARHTFMHSGRFPVRVKVTDNAGRSTTVRKWVVVR